MASPLGTASAHLWDSPSSGGPPGGPQVVLCKPALAPKYEVCVCVSGGGALGSPEALEACGSNHILLDDSEPCRG